jgi:FAD/FMN-containing dehydrogenase
MVDITTLDGALTSVGVADITALRNSLRGRVILASDPDYGSARRVWNGNVDRRPALIARCLNIADVHQSVNFARTRGLLVAVRGGGHSAPGYGTNNGGVVIDLSSMKAISVDQTEQHARAEGGVLWRENSTKQRRPMASPPPAAPSPAPALRA